MLHFIPLLSYAATVSASVLLLRGVGAARQHVIFWLFVAYSLPYALRFALQSVFAFPWSSIDNLSGDEFLHTTLLLNALLAASVIVYRVAHHWQMSRHGNDRTRAGHWANFTASWGLVVYRYLCLVAVGCVALGLIVRFVLQGDRYLLGFAADLDSRQASMGWGFANFILLHISVTIILIAVELRRPRRELILLFLALVTLALISGSKGGFLLPLIYVLAFAFHRRRLAMSVGRLAAIVALGAASLSVGVVLRNWIESGVIDVTAALSPVRLLAPALGRFFAFDLTQIMIAEPSRYVGIVDNFREYSLGAVVPGALWPGKPLNPCLLLADAVEFPLVSCVAPGWVGGILILLGPFGLAFAPLIVGAVTARITWRLSTAPDAISLRQPLTFSVAILWLGIVNEGGYYQVIPIYLPVIVALTTVYFGILMLNGRIGVLPAFTLGKRSQTRVADVTPPA